MQPFLRTRMPFQRPPAVPLRQPGDGKISWRPPSIVSRAWTSGWAGFLVATVAFNALRGAIYSFVEAGGRPVFTDYVIAAERMVVGVPALPLVAQKFTSPGLDAIATAFHLSHFIYFFAIGALIWRSNNRNGAWWQRAMMVTMALGLIGYVLVPTMPPWLAADLGVIEPVRHTVAGFYHSAMPQLQRMFDTNPVAAMPSLHAAFPIVCALIGARTFNRTAAVLLWTYAFGASASAVYLGEHYATDVLAGALVAWIAVGLTTPRNEHSYYAEFSA